MHNLSVLLFFGILIFQNWVLSAPVQCLVGSPKKLAMVDQLHLAKKNSPITQAVYKSLVLEGTTSEGQICEPPTALSQVLNEKNFTQLVDVVQSTNHLKRMIFNPECLRKSVTFSVDSGEISCPGGKLTNDLCVSEEHLEYQNAVISSFYSCFKDLDISTISPGALLNIYSLESGFKPFYASTKGVGIGQLTTDFVADVHQSWRGGEYLEQISKSNSESCLAAKLIAERDIKKTPSLEKKCLFIQVGEGFERNILYTLIGAATAWNKDLLPKMKKYYQRYSNSPGFERVKDLLLVTAHGPGGKNSAINLFGKISDFSPDEILNPKQGRDYFTAKDPYLKNIKTRQGLITQELPADIKIDDGSAGMYSCVIGP